MKERCFQRTWNFLAALRNKIFLLHFRLGLENSFLLFIMKETFKKIHRNVKSHYPKKNTGTHTHRVAVCSIQSAHVCVWVATCGQTAGWLIQIEHTLFCSHQSPAHLLSVPRGADEILCQNGHDHLHLQIVIKGSNPQNMIKLPQGITYDV